MAGQVLECELTRPHTNRVRYSLATRVDDPEIRRLLRDNPMPGRIALSMEREPDFFTDSDGPGATKQTIVARKGRRLLCVGSCVIRERFVNGQLRRVGYLGGLRLDASVAGRSAIVRQGYEFFRSLQTDAPADFYFTSIATDNERALRFLERNVPGMPTYEFLGEFVTLLLRVPQRSETRINQAQTASAARPPTTQELSRFLDQNARLHQLAPSWSAQQLEHMRPLGVSPGSFQFAYDGGRLSGCAALWDQRSFKQLVIRDYAPWLAHTRPWLNLVAPVFGYPRLPAVGTTLAHAFVSHLAVTSDRPGTLIELIDALRNAAAQRQIAFLTLGFAANSPQLALLRQTYRVREYRSRLYLVHWPGIGGNLTALDNRRLAPEVALL